MYNNTIDGKIPLFKIDSYGSYFKVLTNIIRIDEDPNNEDNKKLFFVIDYDYTTQIPYVSINSDGNKTFYRNIPPNNLTAILKINNKKQYECTINMLPN